MDVDQPDHVGDDVAQHRAENHRLPSVSIGPSAYEEPQEDAGQGGQHGEAHVETGHPCLHDVLLDSVVVDVGTDRVVVANVATHLGVWRSMGKQHV